MLRHAKPGSAMHGLQFTNEIIGNQVAGWVSRFVGPLDPPRVAAPSPHYLTQVLSAVKAVSADAFVG
jgi:hypothetical protein